MKTLLTSIALALWLPVLLTAQPTNWDHLTWYPNPATAEQDIHLHLEPADPIDIHIFRADGQRVERMTLDPEARPPHVLFRAGELAAGSYVARILCPQGRSQRVIHFIVE